MSKEIIVVKQLPVIVEQLQTIKAEVSKKVERALSLVCTDSTVVAVKNERTTLRKEFDGWEEQRKAVKKAVMSPYEQFEAVYKECITDEYKIADEKLKEKIETVENELKEQKRNKIKAYFDEYLASRGGIDFITYDNANINVTKTASEKSLKEQAKAFIDRICDDLSLIDTQEHKDEILYEYKQSLNVAAAITKVTNRYKAIEEARKREEEMLNRKQAATEAESKVQKVVDSLTPPKVVEAEPIITTQFIVRGTRTQLKALKEFLTKGGYDFE